MALLQSLRQSEAPPTDPLAAVQPPPAMNHDSAAAHNAGSKPPGGGHVAAGSSGAAFLQQLQGLSIVQQPAPSAAEAAAAPTADGSSIGSTSDVQVCHVASLLWQISGRQHAPHLLVPCWLSREL
jgi:hypothetical protein